MAATSDGERVGSSNVHVGGDPAVGRRRSAGWEPTIRGRRRRPPGTGAPDAGRRSSSRRASGRPVPEHRWRRDVEAARNRRHGAHVRGVASAHSRRRRARQPCPTDRAAARSAVINRASVDGGPVETACAAGSRNGPARQRGHSLHRQLTAVASRSVRRSMATCGPARKNLDGWEQIASGLAGCEPRSQVRP